MTESEAIEWIKELKVSEEIQEFYYANSFIKAFDIAIQALEEVQKYREIGSIEECRASREKQIPKKPTYDGDGYAPDGTFVWDEWLCPCCGERYEVDYDYDYCPNCGQRLDWSDEHETD